MITLVILGLSGCSWISPQEKVRAPELSEADVPEFDYIIGTGDSLEIFIWGSEELSTTVTVRPDGKITTRLVEDLPASGLTSTELARNIEKAYAKYVKSPVVSVIVNGFTGVPTQQVRVVGEATNPTAIPFSKHMTLLDLMIRVGGLSDFADGNDTVLIRRVDGEQTIFSLRVDDLLNDGDITANTTLMPGDIIIIPEAWF
ncbi:sugar ABC transporter substrate-binding protein [Aestuariicella hydrocarbonica]|uniref:Sugar ABC transporter substrate-binding protein n=1 Tax=Pseudomaricurvus hydrocarbonicus TaxID=1470433 RepID=A0A9E5MGI0_9GAMM|nr:sugar ABC transporter substrate-binding protein [Aestuariicella hydrocarbonica]